MGPSPQHRGPKPGPRLVAAAAFTLLLAACVFPGRKIATKPNALPRSTPPAQAAEDNVCEGSGPVPHAYSGILRVARCEQDMYNIMANVATDLDVKCRHCHVPLVTNGKEEPDKEDYPVMTRRKRVANWMSLHLMQAVKPADGSAIACSSCHTDEAGKPVAKILGYPRSAEKAVEWMTTVLVEKFVAANGEKLKCKSCHEASFGQQGFKSEVLLSDHIPAHVVPPPSKPPAPKATAVPSAEPAAPPAKP